MILAEEDVRPARAGARGGSGQADSERTRNDVCDSVAVHIPSAAYRIGKELVRLGSLIS